MSPDQEQRIVQLFVDGHRAGSTPSISLRQLGNIDLAAGYRIAFGTQDSLHAETGVIKVVLRQDGLPAVASPIWTSFVGFHNRDYALPANLRATGVELEVGVKLAKSIRRSEHLTFCEVENAIEYYFLGIEVTGTRLQRSSDLEDLPTANQLLADQNGSLAYVIGARYSSGADVLGRTVTFELGGQEIHRKPVTPGHQNMLSPLLAYAAVAHPRLPLIAGSYVTLGALSGNVSLPEGYRGLVVGRLSDGGVVQFTLA